MGGLGRRCLGCMIYGNRDCALIDVRHVDLCRKLVSDDLGSRRSGLDGLYTLAFIELSFESLEQDKKYLDLHKLPLSPKPRSRPVLH